MSQFPKWKYHAELDPIIVEDETEEAILPADEWKDSPAEHGVVTHPSVVQTQQFARDAHKARLEAMAKRGPGRPKKED